MQNSETHHLTFMLNLPDLNRQTLCFSYFYLFTILIQEKPVGPVSHADPEVNDSGQNSSNAAKEERIRELNQQVDLLQYAICQVRNPSDHSPIIKYTHI